MQMDGSLADGDFVDVVILTILPEEYKAVVGELKKCGTCKLIKGTNLYAWSVSHMAHPNPAYRVVVGTTGAAGNDFMQPAVTDGLNRFQPAVLLVVGGGGGLPKAGDPMVAGDIVVGNAVWSVDRGKIVSQGLDSRPLSQLAGWGLVPGIQAIETHFSDWHLALQNADATPPRIIVGGIAASNNVLTVTEHEIMDGIRTCSGNMVRAVEMESWGAAVSVGSYQAISQKGVLLGIIRGLSDIVRPKPTRPLKKKSALDNSAERNQWKEKAALHAARLAVCLIRDCWPYPPKNASSPPENVPQAPLIDPHACPPGHSAAHIALWDSLFAEQEKGWQSLQAKGLVAIFQTAIPKWGLPALLNSPKGFFDFCTSPTLLGDKLLFLLLDVLGVVKRADTTETKILPPPTQEVFLAMCRVGIESWVKHESSGVPISPPDLSGGVRLQLNDPWAIYLTAAAMFTCKSRIEPGNGGSPRALVNVIAPSEIGHLPTMASVESALNAYCRGEKAIPSDKHPSRGADHTKNLLIIEEGKLRSSLILNVDAKETSNPLWDEEGRRQAWNRYAVHTVLSGGSGECDQKLKAFETQLAELIQDLNAHLYPNAPRPENPP